MVFVIAKIITVEEFVIFVKWSTMAIPIVMIVIVKFKTLSVEQTIVIKQMEIVDVKKTIGTDVMNAVMNFMITQTAFLVTASPTTQEEIQMFVPKMMAHH